MTSSNGATALPTSSVVLKELRPFARSYAALRDEIIGVMSMFNRKNTLFAKVVFAFPFKDLGLKF
jgi:hypothetical protein